MNVTFDLFKPETATLRDPLAALVKAASEFVDMSIEQIISQQYSAPSLGAADIEHYVLNRDDVEAVRSMNKAGGPTTIVVVCFKDFARVQPLIISSEHAEEDFL